MEHSIDIFVEPTDEGIRVDKFLTTQLQGQVSRTSLQSMLDQGEILCNGKTGIQQKYRVRRGDHFAITFKEKIACGLTASHTSVKIIYEDEFLLIVDKPEGMVVHPGHGVEQGSTLVEALLSHCPLSAASGVNRPGVVHRIDQATSGLVLLAKTDATYWQLTRLFAERQIRKVYYALVWGIPHLQSGTIESPVGRSSRDRTAMCICTKGRYALTHWSLKETFKNAHKALLVCEPKTGRTHQIRVHLKSVGHPIVGDLKYGRISDKRLYLHAHQLDFRHPMTHAHVTFQSELPTSFKDEIQRLRTLEAHLTSKNQ
ncbi:MAG: RluA family pseudouridine synthase [Puniceicoccales bacterium]|nr:RluA family pseudouridine synthase [Puniceicoccales bacterium]